MLKILMLNEQREVIVLLLKNSIKKFSFLFLKMSCFQYKVRIASFPNPIAKTNFMNVLIKR